MKNDWKNRFIKNAELLPHMLDIASDQILLSQLSEQDYKAVSFLDQRIFTPQLSRVTVKWAQMEDIKLPANPSPHFIFHIGHVGSTLLSRLLGELPSVLALREPQILRDLCDISQIIDQAHAPWSLQTYNSRRDLVIAWLSRGFHDEQRAMIKASSFVSEMSSELIGSENKTVFLYVSLECYLETILAGEGSRQEAAQLAGARLLRLHQKLDAPIGKLWQLSPVQKISLGWLCEMVTLMQTYLAKDSTLIYWQDFNAFLKNPTDTLVLIAKHFDLDMRPEHARQLINSPIMSSYSKAPEHDYSPDLRRQLLQQARVAHSAEIAQTMSWVEGLAKVHPLIAAIINFADTANTPTNKKD